MHPNNNLEEIDEAVWQKWLNKNQAQNQLRYQWRLRAMALVVTFLAVSAFLWKFVG